MTKIGMLFSLNCHNDEEFKANSFDEAYTYICPFVGGIRVMEMPPTVVLHIATSVFAFMSGFARFFGDRDIVKSIHGHRLQYKL